MTRKSLLPAVLIVCAAALIAVGAWWRHGALPQKSAQVAQTPARVGDTAAPSAGSQPAAAAQTVAAASGPVSTAQAADAGSTSLERLAAVPANAALPESTQWKSGVNYDVISPAQPTTVAPGKVEVMEVFWLGCPHCYALEPYIRAWLKTKPAYVQFVRVPVMWGPVHRAHARLYYTLESLGRDDLVEKVFTYIHDLETQSGSESVLFSNSQADTFKQQQAWAVQNGVNGDAFAKAYNSFYVNTQLQQADEITNTYQVQGVPFIAVDGQFSTDVGKASGGDEPNKLISLIDFLAAWEHDHKQGAG
ncbi:MAG TPA: thiol:disulfide interchange protein DsbA/DsbL [Steroidobacteraceae bacterium]|nr:thiol:disulfide interchange protein DsbA/DsbL [Steroidobacteraceae bacterium]